MQNNIIFRSGDKCVNLGFELNITDWLAYHILYPQQHYISFLVPFLKSNLDMHVLIIFI